MEYYLAIKNKELIHGTTWSNLENSVLNERSQIQNATYLLYDYIYMNCPK